MRIPVFTLAISALVLAACGILRTDSAEENPPEQASLVEPVDLVDRVIGLRIDRTPRGAIIHAVGLPSTQGHWGARLEPVSGEVSADGTIAYRFLVERPLESGQSADERVREMSAARLISNSSLQEAEVIRVIGAANSLTSRL